MPILAEYLNIYLHQKSPRLKVQRSLEKIHQILLILTSLRAFLF